MGSALLLAEGSDLLSGLAAASRGEPMLLPDSLLLGTAAFLIVFSIAGGAMLWPIAGRIDRRDKAAAEKFATDLARFDREGRTRDKARRADVMRARSRWEADARALRPAAPHWTSWAVPLLAALVLAGAAAALAPGALPRWLSMRGYRPCETLDAVRWVHTRRGPGEVPQFGWALPSDCPAAVPGR